MYLNETAFSADLAIIIVNYNVEALLQRCLETIYASQTAFKIDVCVVDNASQDGSAEMVRNRFPQAKLLVNDHNPGYSTANNQGMRLIGIESARPARYHLLLNPDTELEPTTLDDAIRFMDANPTVGVLGPKLLLPSGELDAACRRSFPTPAVSFYRFTGLSRLFPKHRQFGRYNMSFLDIDEMADVDSVVGAFMLVRTEATRQAGLLDEQFWMYGEDLDWAKRIKDNGWRVVYNPDVVAYHVKRASSKQNPKAQREFYRAMLIFYHKHYRQQTSLLLHGLVTAGIALKGGRAIWPDVRAGEMILTR